MATAMMSPPVPRTRIRGRLDPQTLPDLLVELQAGAGAGVCASDLLGRMWEVASDNEIIMKIEAVPGGARPAAGGARPAAGAAPAVTPAVTPAARHTTRFASIYEKGHRVRRVVLTHDRECVHNPTSLTLECSGVVVDTDTWQVVAKPPAGFHPAPDFSGVDRFLKRPRCPYRIITVHDGTIITAYFWNNQWCLATKNGYDVTTLTWIGEKTFAELAFESLSVHAPEFVNTYGVRLVGADAPDPVGVAPKMRLDFGVLPRDHSFTFGFRHHDIHPYRGDPGRAWFVHAYNIRNGETTNEGGMPGVADQPRRDLSEFMEMFRPTRGAARRVAPKATMRMLTDLCDSITVESPEPTYGYILRSDDPGATKMFSNVLIVTSFLRTIRRMIYRRTFFMEYDVRYDTHLQVRVMSTYLTMEDRERFLIVFPQFQESYSRCGDFISRLIGELCRLLPASNPRTGDTPFDELARTLLEHIQRSPGVPNVVHPYTEATVAGIVTDPRYAQLYVDTMLASDRGR